MKDKRLSKATQIKGKRLIFADKSYVGVVGHVTCHILYDFDGQIILTRLEENNKLITYRDRKTHLRFHKLTASEKYCKQVKAKSGTAPQYKYIIGGLSLALITSKWVLKSGTRKLSSVNRYLRDLFTLRVTS